MASGTSPKRNDVSPAVVVVVVPAVVLLVFPSPAGVGVDGVGVVPSPDAGGVGAGAHTVAASLQVWYRAFLVPVLTVESLGHLH